MKDKKIDLLKRYFSEKPNVVLAFLFGSRADGTERQVSDWDIAVYFKPAEYMETETDKEYEDAERIWTDMMDILSSDEVDLVVLNRARPSIVYSVLRKGVPLVIKDRGLYLDLLCKVSYEAEDWWGFVSDYFEICERATSIPPEEKSRILEYLRFLEREFGEIEEIRNFTWQDYLEDSFKRKVVERWVENLVMAALDIVKIILASNKREIPQTYKETLRTFGTLYIDQSFAERFGRFAIMRNILVHDYLDARWKRITRFIEEADELYPLFIKKVKEIVKKQG